MTTLTVTNKDAFSIPSSALVVAVGKGDDGPVLIQADQLPEAVRNSVAASLAALGVKGGADEITRLPAAQGVAASTVVLSGVGPIDRADAEVLRRAAGAAVRTLTGLGHIVLALPAATLPDLAAVVEGGLLGAYSYTRYLESAAAQAKTPADTLTVVSPLAKDKQARAVIERAEVLAESVALAKDLVNCPPNDLYPQRFAELAGDLGRQQGLKVSVLDDQQLRADGYGGLTAVGQGSSRGPRLVKLSWWGGRRAPSLALVGKGITFDSGGLSLKPADSMKTMKLDMGGAAAVLATVLAAARLGLPVNVTGWLCLAENMPSGTATRPSDVIRIYGGTTVEVLNTDAEGRLVLADGLVAASAEDPDAIIDIATLTGAQMIALGNRVSAVMANDDGLREQVCTAAAAVGEQFWPMPLPPELRPSLDSTVADLSNIGERMGGMMTAGLFLAEFVGTRGGKGRRDKKDGAPRKGEPIPWAHLDIAGPAFNEGTPWGYTGKGGTGVGVRTLLGVIEAMAR